MSKCGVCGHTLEQKNKTLYICSSCHKETYNNPRAAVAVVVIDGRNILLARRSNHPNKGRLDPIGGFLDYNEQPLDGLRREIGEETNLDIDIGPIVGVYTHEYGEGSNVSVCPIIYVGKINSGTLEGKDDVASLEWVSVDDTPKADMLAWSFMPQLFADLRLYIDNAASQQG